jgi:hypothetical protein
LKGGFGDLVGGGVAFDDDPSQLAGVGREGLATLPHWLQVFADRFCDKGLKRRHAAVADFADDIVRFASGTHCGHEEQARPARVLAARSAAARPSGAGWAVCLPPGDGGHLLPDIP